MAKKGDLKGLVSKGSQKFKEVSKYSRHHNEPAGEGDNVKNEPLSNTNEDEKKDNVVDEVKDSESTTTSNSDSSSGASNGLTDIEGFEGYFLKPQKAEWTSNIFLDKQQHAKMKNLSMIMESDMRSLLFNIVNEWFVRNEKRIAKEKKRFAKDMGL
tara:strand:- start:116 stop:583 length:468 start_codon:yes stop_codon:yes gene_type:complete